MPDVLLQRNFPDSSPAGNRVALTVWTKRNWNDPWQQWDARDLWPEHLRWCIQPKMPTADFTHRYGSNPLRGEVERIAIDQLGHAGVDDFSLARHFVMVEVGPDDGSGEPDQDSPLFRRWTGQFRIIADHPFGQSAGRVPTGEQHLLAFGLEVMFDDVTMDRLIYGGNFQGFDSGFGPGWGPSDELRVTDVVLDFNEEGRPNRLDAMTPIYGAALGGFESYAFHPGDYYSTYENGSLPVYWSSRSIVNYVVKQGFSATQTRPFLQIPDINIEIPDEGLIPELDRPVVQQSRRTVRQVINSVLTRHRLHSWWLESDREGEISLRVCSLADQNVLLNGPTNGWFIIENPDKINLDWTHSPSSKVVVQSDSSHSYTKVTCRGARRRLLTTVGINDKLEVGWTDSEFESFRDATEEISDLINRDEKELQRKKWRMRPEFDNVLSRFNVLLHNIRLDSRYGFARALKLLDNTFLIEGVDYTGTLEASQMLEPAGDVNYLPILAFIEDPENPTFYIPLHDLQSVGDVEPWSETKYEWSAAVRVGDDDKSLVLQTSRPADRQILAVGSSDEWSGTDTDVDENQGAWSFQDILITLAVEWDQWCEGSYGYEDDNPGDEPDYHHTFVIDMGPRFRWDTIETDAVVGLADDGSLTYISGPTGDLHDDREVMAGYAEVAYRWYATPRIALDLETHPLSGNGEITLGQMLERLTVDQDTELDCNSVVSQIDLLIQSRTSDEPEIEMPAPVLSIKTDFAELDLTKL